MTRPRVLVELGTHVGPSYFAFCESVARLGLGTSCFAVDTWIGDEHAGFYGEEVYDSVREINSRYYESFSRLLRNTFDDAVERFADSSIDLLHIDGLHTYEAVRHDFETWLPKLSQRAVVLLHDTNERKEDFGVHRFLAELSEIYPVFEFLHGHGLGVVAVGPEVPDGIAALVGIEEAQVSEVRGLYEALGGRLSAELERARLTKTIAGRDERLGGLSEAIVRRDAEIGQLSEKVAEQDEKLGGLSEAVVRRDAEIRGLSDAIAQRETERAGLVDAVARRDGDLERMSEEIARADEKLALADGKVRELTRTNSALKRDLASTRKAFRRLRNRRSVRLSLAISRPFRPLFRLVRKGTRPPTPTSTGPKVDPVPADGTVSIAPTTISTPRFLPSLEPIGGPTTIIVPIFNAPDALRACLRSLVRNTTGDTELLLIDDASTDGRVSQILDDIASVERVTVLRNDENLGFVRTVNRGFAASTGDVVILNSDTEVTPGWLDRLKLAARIVPEAGTITPLSDNAGAFSAPVMAEMNPVPAGMTKDEVGRLVAQQSKRTYPRTPTGNGYCMYVRRACLDDVGDFDDEAFPIGYGEENDLCMRAAKKGWVSIVDDSTYIFHERSASFGEGKRQLMEAGREVLDRRYPDYGTRVRSFVSSEEMISARETIGEAFDNAASLVPGPRPRVLFVLHGARGGTPATTRDLSRGLLGSYESFLLVSDGKVLRLSRLGDADDIEIGRWKLQKPISVVDTEHAEYRDIVQSILIDNAIEIVHIRHLIGHTFELPGVAQALNVPVVLSFHDFYYVCPTVHLMDDHGRFCGGTCSVGQGVCPIPTPWLEGLPHLKHAWVYDWRGRAAAMFEDVDAFITTSQSMHRTYTSAFRYLQDRAFEVIEHGRDLSIAASPVGEAPSAHAPIRILLAGNITPHKGSQFVRSLAELDKDGRLEFHLLGKADAELEGIAVPHGLYERSEFESRARDIAPSFFALFSTTAESFSHVLTEAWAAGLPVLASNLGAQEQRIEQHGGGWTIDVEDPTLAYRRILEIAADTDEYCTQQDAAIVAARRSSSLEQMAFRYGQVYRKLARDRKAFASPEASMPAGDHFVRVGVFLPGPPNGMAAPSAHIRVLTRFLDPEVADRLAWIRLGVDDFLDDGALARDLDVAFVQRTAVPSADVDAFIDKCRSNRIGIVFDIDDDLLSDDPDWAEREHYQSFRHSVEALLSEAAAVTVSTPALAAELDGGDSSVVLLPNGIDKGLWYRPIESASAGSRSNVTSTVPRGLRLLFIGGPSHAGDLEILRPALDKVRGASAERVDLFVIGGAGASDRQDWYESVEIPPDRRHYPEFVEWVRSHGDLFDIAVAPLAPTRLNESKSDLRFLEYGALGLPGIYSRCAAFSSVDDGETGLVVDNTPDAWSEAILRLRDDAGLRERIRAHAADYVASKRLISAQADEFLTILLAAANEGQP